MKVYLINSNNTLVNALLRKTDNCCLPSEVERELKKHNLRPELVSFFERQNRHREALQLINDTPALSSNDTILNYLAKLDNDQLPLIIEYVKPMIKYAFEDKDNDLLREILTLFIGEPTPTSPSVMDTPGQRTIKLDPIKVHDFFDGINQDFAMKYLESIRFKSELGPKQREIHNRLVFAYCDRLKQLSKRLRALTEPNTNNNRQGIYQGRSFQ